MAKKKNIVNSKRSYYWILGLTTALALFGLVMVTSASQIVAFAKYNDSLFFLKRQLLYLVGGAILFWIFSKMDYHKLRPFSLPLAITSMLLLVLVFIPSIGYSAGGSSRWIPLGFMNFQPSELAKIAAVLLAVYLIDSKREESFSDISSLIPFAVILVMAVLVMAQPDMGTTILIVGTVFVVMILGGLPWRYAFGISATGAVLSSGLILFEPYRFRRLISFIAPEQFAREGGFQITQSLIALGSGGIAGTGLAMSKQKFFYLPAAHTDFIMAIVGEEFGIIGTTLLVGAFIMLAVYGFSVAYNAPDNYGRLLAGGLSVMIIGQAVVNMGAVVGLLPITGVPLPLVSYGGSSLLVIMTALGIIASVATYNRRIA